MSGAFAPIGRHQGVMDLPRYTVMLQRNAAERTASIMVTADREEHNILQR